MSTLELLIVIGGGGLVFGFVAAICAGLLYTILHVGFDAWLSPRAETVLARRKGFTAERVSAGSLAVTIAVAVACSLISAIAALVICGRDLPFASAVAFVGAAAVAAVWGSAFVGAYFDRLAKLERKEAKSPMQSASQEKEANRRLRLRNALMTSVLTVNTLAIALVCGREAAGYLSTGAIGGGSVYGTWLTVAIAVSACLIGIFTNQPGVLVQRSEGSGEELTFGGKFSGASQRSVPAQQRLRR